MDLGYDINEIYEMEPDPGLGNGGLGRLAACFMDALTTQDYHATGFSICYEYGLFKQKIIDGNQVELPDNWMGGGDTWLVPRTDKAFDIRLGGTMYRLEDVAQQLIAYVDGKRKNLPELEEERLAFYPIDKPRGTPYNCFDWNPVYSAGVRSAY